MIWRWLVVVICVLASALVVSAEEFGRPAFRDRWERTDYPIQQGVADHSWIWGPEPFTPVLQEWYGSSPGERRSVQYIDKSRMEINDPDANPNSQWYVTNGLLAREMITGQVQVGDNAFIPLTFAGISLAGDPDNDFPTYADLQRIYNMPPGFQIGDHVDQLFTRQGFENLPQYANRPATEIVQVEQGYGIPRAFWDYLTRGGTIYQNGRFVRVDRLFDWLYVVGYPLTDAYWSRVRVGGVEQDVMFQAFERRVLTYTPNNPAQFQVEMGNVGQHYYQWRYVNPFAGGQQAVITSLEELAAIVESPLQVQGFENGTAFEARVTVRLRTEGGDTLAQEATTVHRPDILVAGPFSTTLTFDAPPQDTFGTVEVVTFSPRDGAETIIASRQVTILGSSASGPPQSIINTVRQDLAARLNISPDVISVVSTEAVEWRNAALECPAPDQAYAEVITPGYRIILEAQGQQYEYRTDTQGNFVLCQNGQPAPPVNGSGAAIEIPAADARVVLPLHIQARVPSPADQVTAILRWDDGTELTRTFTLLNEDGQRWLIGSLDWTDPVPPQQATQPATLELRDRGGTVLATRRVTVLSRDDRGVRQVDLYWLLDDQLETEQRLVVDTPAIGTATLEELLWGPGPRNFAGFTTAIPTPEEVLNYPGREPDWGPRVTLRSLVIEEGVATADFSQEIRAYGGGSARVQSIRDQITQTLLQFPTVNEVVIAVEGETDGVLQP